MTWRAWFRRPAPREPETPPAIPVHAVGDPAPRDADARFARCVAVVLKHEGGYANPPRDPGGATNMGITLATLRAWRQDPTLTADDVRALTQAEAERIYRVRYWALIRGDDLPPGVDLAVFDWAVNAGPGRAAKGLQRALGVTVDGAIGPITLRWAREREPGEVIAEVCRLRLAHLRGLATWPTFGRGWTRRVEDVEARALAMARAGLV